MSDERIDPETLAAFLEGRVSPEEREAVLRTLARSKEAYASFMEASAIHRELADSSPISAGAAVVPPPAAPDRLVAGSVGGTAREAANARWFRPRRFAPILIAAGFFAILIARGGTRRAAEDEAIRLAQGTTLTTDRGSGTLTRTLGDTWDQPPWSIVRGGETTSADRALAVRAGVRFAEFEIAAQLADSTAATSSAQSIAQLLSNTEGAAPIAATFRDLASAPSFGGRSQRATSAGQLRALLGTPDWFDLGVWAGTARLAALAGDTAFFAPGSRGTSSLRRLLEGHTGNQASDEWRPVVNALQPVLMDRVRRRDELAEVGRAVDSAIAEAAR